jgi:hypothetical protein
MWCCLVELWGVCSVSANVSLVPPSAPVSLILVIPLMVVSDRYGRKKVLLATMTGNILSAVVWLRSTTFVSPTIPPELTVGVLPTLALDRWTQRRKCPAQHSYYRRCHRNRDEVKVPCSDWNRLFSLLHLWVRPQHIHTV